jgi:hypothetical protein
MAGRVPLPAARAKTEGADTIALRAVALEAKRVIAVGAHLSAISESGFSGPTTGAQGLEPLRLAPSFGF